MLTLGDYGFHRHFRPKQACSMGYARGAGRARLAPGALDLQSAVSWLTLVAPSQRPPKVAVLSALVPRLCVPLLQEGPCQGHVLCGAQLVAETHPPSIPH